MTHFDVFNGDADGICALLQLRLANPKKSTLISGVKRDISLVSQVNAKADDTVTVLDMSFDKNTEYVQRLLELGVKLFYCDHHQAKTKFEHPNLEFLHNPHAEVCTSLLINDYVDSAYPEWAITGAYGDNLAHSAQLLAKAHAVPSSELSLLKKLGTAINYNAYGVTRADLYMQPEELYKTLLSFSSPLAFISECSNLFSQLVDNYEEDITLAKQIEAYLDNDSVRVFMLPNAAFSRRVSGVFANFLTNQEPAKAHAVITDIGDYYQVGVRAPLNQKQGADKLCSEFPTGGGRTAAAGINQLAKSDVDYFIQRFSEFYA